MQRQEILVTEGEKDYELIDSGEGLKYERFGDIKMVRPDPQAVWGKRLSKEDWAEADVEFDRSGALSLVSGKSGRWIWKRKDIPKDEKWLIDFAGQKMYIKPTPFKHTGVFPEQSENWKWTKSKIGKDDEVLNLFGYTGGATIACLKAGAKVVHVDGSKSAITWARENAEASGVANLPVRWILEDARIFVEREIKRGRKYQGIIMDPPAFGHGAKKEVWKIDEDLLPLVKDCISLLDVDKAKFILINGYSAGYSPIAYGNMLQSVSDTVKVKGEIAIGEIGIRESGANGRILPAGIFGRWEAK